MNHDHAAYEVPVHADISAQEVTLLHELAPASSPMKDRALGKFGICGASAAIANTTTPSP